MPTQASPRLTNESMPNVMAFSFISPDSGTKFTLFRSTPGESAPRMQMQAGDGKAVAVAVVEPERFGPYSTRAEFKAWCEAFIQAGVED